MRLIAGSLETDIPADVVEDLISIAESTGATIQAFDARYIIGSRHLGRAMELADRAIERERTIADERAVEILLYAAGRRQINRALEIGLKPQAHPVIVLVDGSDNASAIDAIKQLFVTTWPADGRDADRELIKAYFDIGDAELSTGATVSDLVLERVALLTVNR